MYAESAHIFREEGEYLSNTERDPVYPQLASIPLVKADYPRAALARKYTPSLSLSLSLFLSLARYSRVTAAVLKIGVQ